MKNQKKFRSPYFLLCCFWVVTAPALVSQSSQAPYSKALDSLLDLQGVTSRTPGFAVCIVENGRIVYEKQAGMANTGKKIPITGSTRFNIGSLAKQFTVMCILLLEEEGKLKLSDEIHLYIPELPDYGYPITIRHLIGHTSGLRSYPELLALQNKNSNWRYLNHRMLAYQQAYPTLNFPPGEDYNYSNTGYMLMCTIVERLSGMPLSEFASKRIFEPLGMSDTNFQVDGARGVTGGTASYEWKPGGKKFIKEMAFVDALGATGVHTTLRDLVKWDQNFYHNQLGAGRQELINRMETPDTLNSGKTTYYAGGLFIRSSRGFPEIEHTGGWGSFSAQYRRFPLQGISILTAGNISQPSAYQLNDLICGLLMAQNSAAKVTGKPLPPGLSLTDLTGTYLSDNNWVRKVQVVGSELYIAMGTGENAAKRPLYFQYAEGDNVMFHDSLGNPVEFYKTQGQVSGFWWTGGHYFPEARVYRKQTTENATPIGLFAGKYKSADIKVTIKIRYHPRKQQLVIHPFPCIHYELNPVADGVFEIPGEGIILRFSEKGVVIGDTWNRGIVMKRMD